jgi:hypothetical protein
MDHQVFNKYLKEYTLNALASAGESVAAAADYLEKQSEPGLFAKDRVEKKAALLRVRKIFEASRGRSLYVALKSLGFDNLAKDQL